jgi:hypothetical protein
MKAPDETPEMVTLAGSTAGGASVCAPAPAFNVQATAAAAARPHGPSADRIALNKSRALPNNRGSSLIFIKGSPVSSGDDAGALSRVRLFN